MSPSGTFSHTVAVPSPDTKEVAEARAIECGLAAVRNLNKMDEARGDAPHWRPSMGF